MQHRVNSNFSLLANWTWSKCLDIADGQGDLAATNVENPNNPKMDWGPCGFDFRDVENVVLVARSNFSEFNRFGRAVANDWEFAPLIHITSGSPVNVTAGVDNSLTDIGNDRPILVPGVSPYAKANFRSGTGEANREYLNPAAFAQVTASCPGGNVNGCSTVGTYGNLSKNPFRTPPFFQFDGQVSRVFPLHERLNLDLRLEAFNVLNHPNFTFSSATQTLSSSTFGQISSQAGSGARVFQGVAKIVF